MKRNSLFKEKSPVYAIIFVALVIYSATLFIPLIWTVLVAFKDSNYYTQSKLTGNAAGLVNLSHLTFDNFKTAFNDFVVTTPDGVDYNIIGLFGNSLLYSFGCALCATIVPCVIAYLCARYKYRFGKLVYGIVLVAMALPIVGNLPSEIRMVNSLHLFDSVLGMLVLKSNFLGIYF